MYFILHKRYGKAQRRYSHVRYSFPYIVNRHAWKRSRDHFDASRMCVHEKAAILEQIIVIVAVVCPIAGPREKRGARDARLKFFIQIATTGVTHNGDGRVLTVGRRGLLHLGRRAVLLGFVLLKQLGWIVFVQGHAPVSAKLWHESSCTNENSFASKELIRFHLPGTYLSLPTFRGNVQRGVRRGGCHHAARDTFFFGDLLHIAIVSGRVLSLLNHLSAFLDPVGLDRIVRVQLLGVFFPLHGFGRGFRGGRGRRFSSRALASKALGLWNLLGTATPFQLRRSFRTSLDRFHDGGWRMA